MDCGWPVPYRSLRIFGPACGQSVYRGDGLDPWLQPVRMEAGWIRPGRCSQVAAVIHFIIPYRQQVAGFLSSVVSCCGAIERGRPVRSPKAFPPMRLGGNFPEENLKEPRLL